MSPLCFRKNSGSSYCSASICHLLPIPFIALSIKGFYLKRTFKGKKRYFKCTVERHCKRLLCSAEFFLSAPKASFSMGFVRLLDSSGKRVISSSPPVSLLKKLEYRIRAQMQMGLDSPALQRLSLSLSLVVQILSISRSPPSPSPRTCTDYQLCPKRKSGLFAADVVQQSNLRRQKNISF